MPPRLMSALCVLLVGCASSEPQNVSYAQPDTAAPVAPATAAPGAPATAAPVAPAVGVVAPPGLDAASVPVVATAPVTPAASAASQAVVDAPGPAIPTAVQDQTGLVAPTGDGAVPVAGIPPGATNCSTVDGVTLCDAPATSSEAADDSHHTN